MNRPDANPTAARATTAAQIVRGRADCGDMEPFSEYPYPNSKIVMALFWTAMAFGAFCIFAILAALAILLIPYHVFIPSGYDYRDDPETDAEFAFCRAYEHGFANPDLAIAEYAKAIALANADPRHSYDVRTPITGDSTYGAGMLASAAHSNRGVLHFETGNRRAALADFDSAIEIDPRMRMAYENRGIVHVANGDYDAATADYDKAISFSENRRLSRYAGAYLGRAAARALAGNREAALDDYDKAISLGGGGYGFSDLNDLTENFPNGLWSVTQGGPRGNLCPDDY